MQSNDTTTAPLTHVGSTAELGLWEVHFSPRRYSLTVRNWTIRRRNPDWHGGYELMLTRCADTRRYATEKAAQKVADIANAMQPNTTMTDAQRAVD